MVQAMIIMTMYCVTQLTDHEKEGLARLYKIFGDNKGFGFCGGLCSFGAKLSDCDEVYPGIYVGNDKVARRKAVLKQLGITHVINSAEGREMGQVDTGPDFYRDVGIHYLGIGIMDMPNVRISLYFELASNFIQKALESKGSTSELTSNFIQKALENKGSTSELASNFIQKALESKGSTSELTFNFIQKALESKGHDNHGKVLVHCMMGLSRSPTIVMAFLIMKRGLTAELALRTVKSHREVRPNDGFLLQLLELEDNVKARQIG
ncbi:DUSP3 [Cordylochernes scorpioides]|uniref:protein-serine/threonine phosphatase n=1 Tax=Cordylochernes scorpioides TaxID=51811 RepID=A0ABY6LJK9_9ARAC|nr:DUSP3 [Cordylochernes scorpioides]